MRREKRKIAILLQFYQNFDQGVFRGIATYARERGNWSFYVEEEAHHWIPNLRDWNGDGMIVNFDFKPFVRAVQKWRKPIVGIGGGGGWHQSNPYIPYVTTDNAAAGRIAADHLMDMGLRNFAFCGFPPTRTNTWARERERAFKTRLVERGHACQSFHGSFVTGKRWNSLQRELVTWLQSLRKPVGVMGCYDWRARHVLEACRASGLRVPDDVALIGVDNDQMLCEVTDPPLTSIEQGRHGIGYAAAAMLDRGMNGEPPEDRICRVPPTGLVIRQSTQILATQDALVASALSMIRAEACAGLTADRVAERLKISRTTLDDRLRRAISRTADIEIRRVRLAKAQELLSQTDLPLRLVARQSGYANEQYLCMVMKKDIGMTPGQYRKAPRWGGFAPT